MSNTNFEDLIMRDIATNRPAAGKPGRLFYDTTNEKWQRDTGLTWEDCEPAAGASYTDEQAQDAVGAMAAGSLVYNDATPSLQLSGDNATPGDNKVYGTNGSGTKGWKDDPTGSLSRTLIAEVTPGGTATATFSAISGTYKTLEIDYVARSATPATYDTLIIEFNSDTTAANYRVMRIIASAANTLISDGADNRYVTNVAAANSPANSAGYGRIIIPFYALTTFNKQIISNWSSRGDTSSAQEYTGQHGLEWENAAAITQVVLKLLSGANFATGSTFRLYGVP